MKKMTCFIIVILGVVFAFGKMAFTEQAKQLRVNKNGDVRIVEVDERDASRFEQLAFENPDKGVDSNFDMVKYKKVDFFHYAVTTRYDEVKYISAENRFFYFDKEMGGDKIEFAWHVVLLILTLVAVAWFNFRIKRYSINAFLFSLLPLFLSACAGLFFCIHCGENLLFFASPIAAFLVAFNFERQKNTRVRFFSVICCVFTIWTMFI